MKTLRWILCLIAFQPLHAQDSEPGKQLYYDFGCYGCHGFNATMRVPLIGDASGIMSSEEVFLSYLRLRSEQNPINPKNAMPNYSAETLNDDEARKIYAYIRSIDDDAPEVDENAIMQEILDAAKMRGQDESN